MITADSVITFCNDEVTCRLTMAGEYRITADRVIYPNAEVFPTTNGVLVQANLMEGGYSKFLFETQRPCCQIRNNNKYVAFMKEDFVPMVTISAIGSLDSNGELCSPSELSFRKLNDCCYEIAFISARLKAKKVMFEINMQDAKMFQDTTVESKHPDENNVFGGTAYIGQSPEYGIQWLYARPDYGVLNDLFRKRIKHAILHIPILNNSQARVSAVALERRFCSFGSSWRNKKAETTLARHSDVISQYHRIDITDFIVKDQKLLTQSEGWIIKNAAVKQEVSVIPTGDSFFAPQIMEISFEK